MLSAAIVFAGTVSTSCKPSASKTENAQQDLNEAKLELKQANEDYQIEINDYRQETAEKISDNDRIIADFKVKIKHEKKDAKSAYEEKIAQLEQKNKELKQKMDDYRADGKEKWETFKTEFNHDMDELGRAFKDLTIKNTK